MYLKSIIKLIFLAGMFLLIPGHIYAGSGEVVVPAIHRSYLPPDTSSEQNSQSSLQKTLLVIAPFGTLGLETATAQTVELLLKQEILKNNRYQVVPESTTLQVAGDEACMEVQCAVELGKKLRAQQVVVGTLSRLGEKVIFQYMLVNVANGKVLVSDNITAETVEDLDTVMKRVALSLIEQKPVEKTGQVGAITQAESKIPARRSARKYSGISFGYLYPQSGYDNDNRSFTIDFRLGYELQQLTIGSQFAARKGFAANVYGSYLLTGTDICPFVGGAFGFHWVNHEHRSYYDNGLTGEDNRKGDGFEIMANTGLRLFRTYNFEVLVNLDYSYTFNDYKDKALIFTIGILK